MELGDILSDPWFLEHLPPGAADMNGWYLKHAPDREPVRAAAGRRRGMGPAAGSPAQTRPSRAWCAHIPCPVCRRPHPARPAAAAVQLVPRIEAMVEQAAQEGRPGEPTQRITFERIPPPPPRAVGPGGP